MYYKTLNLKESMPTVAVAIAMLEIEIEACKLEGISVLKVVHGYGSHGVGGEINKSLKLWLINKKRNKYICDYVLGEMWPTSKVAEKIKIVCPEVLADRELYCANPGITIILL